LFARLKAVRQHQYVQLIDNYRDEGKTRQRVITTLDVVFFDTTSIYFERKGGETVGQYGNSKDHRPDRKQMVVGVVLDDEGRPICCELWPGNTTDVKTLVPIVDRLRKRFHIGSICIVADRRMVSADTIEEIERRGWEYIDVDRLEEIELDANGKRFVLRNAVQGCCGKVYQAAGVAMPPTIREEGREGTA